MVTRAAKQMLRHTIRTVGLHNRILEEQDMWRQWELEQGLTMMVSDDAIRTSSGRMRMDEIQPPRKLKDHCREEKHDIIHKIDTGQASTFWLKKFAEAEEKDPDRWGHSGYRELYPDDLSDTECKTWKTYTVKEKERWDHSGYEELYPEEFQPLGCNTILEPCEAKGKHRRKRKKRNTRQSKGPKLSPSGDNVNSDEEIWQEFRKLKHHKKLNRRACKHSDSVWDGKSRDSAKRLKRTHILRYWNAKKSERRRKKHKSSGA